MQMNMLSVLFNQSLSESSPNIVLDLTIVEHQTIDSIELMVLGRAFSPKLNDHSATETPVISE